MRNELDNKLGTPVTLQFGFATPAAEATTDGTFAQGTPGFVVPDGYHFVSVLVSVAANDAIAAGTAHFRVTNDGTEVARGRGPAAQAGQVVRVIASVVPGSAPVSALARRQREGAFLPFATVKRHLPLKERLM